MQRVSSVGRRSSRPIRAISSPVVAAAATSLREPLQQLPEDLRNATAIVKAGDLHSRYLTRI